MLLRVRGGYLNNHFPNQIETPMENKIKSRRIVAGLCACGAVIIAIIWSANKMPLPKGVQSPVDSITSPTGSQSVVNLPGTAQEQPGVGVNAPANEGQVTPSPVDKTGELALTPTATITPSLTQTNTPRPKLAPTSTRSPRANLRPALDSGAGAPTVTRTAEKPASPANTITPIPTVFWSPTPTRGPVDLIITEVRVSFNFTYSGGCALRDTMSKVVTVNIKNTGYGDAGPFVLRAGKTDYPINGLRRNESITIHTESEFNLVVDFYNQVAESNETNNASYNLIQATPTIFCTEAPYP
jgi:hypothetical protein